MTKITTLQKARTRYIFINHTYSNGEPRYTIQCEKLLITGSSLTSREVRKEEGNAFYKKLIEMGFKQFRNVKEVSWYATIENNTPYEEEWTTEGKYLIPIKSRVLETETA